MSQAILLFGIAVATLAVVLSIRHLWMTLAAKREFSSAIAEWLSEDETARRHAEQLTQQSPRHLSEDYYEQLIKRCYVLPERLRREILVGLDSNSDEGRASFAISLLSKGLEKSGARRGLSEYGSPYEIDTAPTVAADAMSTRARYAPAGWGAIGLAVGAVAAAAVFMIGNGTTLPSDVADLPSDVADLQRRAEAQEINRQMTILAPYTENLKTSSDERVLATQVTDKILDLAKAGQQSAHAQEVVWRLGQLGELYLKAGEYDKAKPYLDAASEVAAEFHLKDSSGIFKTLGDLYLKKGDSEQAKLYYTKSLGPPTAGSG